MTTQNKGLLVGRASQQNLYIWLIVLQSILYGIMDIITKLAYQDMNAYCFLFLRYILATMIMLVLWHKDIFAELRKVHIRHYIVPGLCMATAFIFSNVALLFTAATNMSFIRSLSALIAPLLALLFFKQKYGKKEPVLQFAMLIGLYLLCAKGGLGQVGLGELLAFIAASLVAGSLVFGKTSLEYISAKTLSFVQTILAVFFCGIAALCTGSIQDAIYANSLTMMLYLLYAAIGCTIVGYMLQNIALEHISAKQVGMIQCLYPIATAVAAFIVLGEMLSPAGIIGAIIITACVLLENAL